MGELAYIPLNQIRANPAALRDVKREAEPFKELVASIRAQGVLTAISLRKKTDDKTQEDYYELIDGLQRFTASQEAGKSDIPAQILQRTDAEALEAQIIANVQRVETKPVEYTRGLIRLLSMNPTLTEAGLATQLGKSPAWIVQRLSLNKLDPKVGELVDEGKIPLANAYALTKLPVTEQPSWISRAMTEGTAEFTPAVVARAKEINAANRAGRDAAPATFEPTAYLRKLSEIRDELSNPVAGPQLIADNNVTDVGDAWNLAISWVLNLDPESKKVQVAKYEERKKKDEEAKIRREAEKKEARAKEAAERQAKLQKEAAEAREKAAALPPVAAPEQLQPA